MAERKRLGDVLTAEKVITQEQLVAALSKQKELNLRLGEALMVLGYATAEDIADALSRQLGVEYMILREVKFQEEAVRLVNRSLAQRYEAVPITIAGDTLVVGMVDPLNVLAIDDIEFMTNRSITPVVMTPKDISRAIEWVYDTPGFFNEEDEENLPAVEVLAEDAPVVKLVNSIIAQAFEERTSDIHIEPGADKLSVRYRIDGVLQSLQDMDMDVHPALVSRLKIVSNLDISERRLPQDGALIQMINNMPIDIRISTLPTVHGEKVVLRIHDKGKSKVGIEQLGINSEEQARLKQLLKLPHGMLLVTGPTGSGKTTTLYACLGFVNDPGKNIITIEDPVENRFDGISQVNINPKIGLDYALILRSVLRQDPNVVMVGEIRDQETAEISVRAAITGHIVLSSLHTNNAAGAITRLSDMGVAPYLTSSAVTGVLAQRLIRKVCPQCREEYSLSLDSPIAKGLGLDTRFPKRKSIELYRASEQGCTQCRGSGYRGRTGIFELLLIDEDIQKLILSRESTSTINSYAIGKGMKTLRDDAIDKLLSGMTTIEEVAEVVFPRVLR